MRWDDDDDFADNFFAGEHNCAIYEWNSSFIALLFIHDLFYNIKNQFLICIFKKCYVYTTSIWTTIYTFYNFDISVSMTTFGKRILIENTMWCIKTRLKIKEPFEYII